MRYARRLAVAAFLVLVVMIGGLYPYTDAKFETMHTHLEAVQTNAQRIEGKIDVLDARIKGKLDLLLERRGDRAR